VERRDFLRILWITGAAAAVPQIPGAIATPLLTSQYGFYEDMNVSPIEMRGAVQYMVTKAPDVQAVLRSFHHQDSYDDHNDHNPFSVQYLRKMANFENAYSDDVYLDEDQHGLLVDTFERMGRVQLLVGHGNFNVIGFDDMLKFARHYPEVGAFRKVEADFLEELFFHKASRYGFMGDKVITDLTAGVAEKERLKIARTGHYLYRGEAEALYLRVQKDLGDRVVLTSGIRSVVKQTHLFLAKTVESRGNLSRASRSLAPPGHSYHGIGDFDVGKVGFGARNFTADFAQTAEFRRLVELGYVDMRYPRQNPLGVRYEPWHIKVV
jgi:zinc D-Ala-D-Ala carboxypeptidase